MRMNEFLGRLKGKFTPESSQAQTGVQHSGAQYDASQNVLPHYVVDYRAHVRKLLEKSPEAEAMALAVGGEFLSFGAALKDFLVQCGLKDGMTLVDVGCGSGRLAYALRQMDINYVGTDVVPELTAYAERICARTDWHFNVVTRLQIPMPDACADFVTFFSVFTHLRHEETFIYLKEAKRVLKPGGSAIFTFLDFCQPHHWWIFQDFVHKIETGRAPMHVDQFIDKSTIAVWARHLEMEIQKTFDGTESYIALSQEITRDSGEKVSGSLAIGQSACVLIKG